MTKAFCGGLFFLVIIVHIFNTRGRNFAKNRKLKKKQVFLQFKNGGMAGAKPSYWRKDFFLLYMRKYVIFFCTSTLQFTTASSVASQIPMCLSMLALNP
jgi:hypothetical protein